MIFLHDAMPNNGGTVLWGDFHTLKVFHEYLMRVSEISPTLDPEGIVPALAYDVRKAYNGERETSKAIVGQDHITFYGVEVTWPTIIMQVILLRSSLAYFPSSLDDQACTYQLESWLQSAVRAAFPKTNLLIEEAMESMRGLTEEDGFMPRLGSRESYFLRLSKAKRRDELPMVLSSMKPMWRAASGNDKADLFDGHSWDTIQPTVKL